MKIEVGEEGYIVLSEVYVPVVVRVPMGDFGIVQRDGGIEISHQGDLVHADYPEPNP